MKKKTIVRNIEKDIYKIIADCEKANEKYSKNKLTNAQYEALRYIYACKAQFLVRVVQLAKTYKISFDLPVKMDKLPEDVTLEEINLEALVSAVAEDLSSNVNFKEMENVEDQETVIAELLEKYSQYLPLEEELTVEC